MVFFGGEIYDSVYSPSFSISDMSCHNLLEFMYHMARWLYLYSAIILHVNITQTIGPDSIKYRSYDRLVHSVHG